MRQTHTYTSTHYVRDNGFPLAWMFRCCISRDMVPAEVEAAEHHSRAEDARRGKVIGKPVLSGNTASRVGTRTRTRTREWKEEGGEPGPEVETAVAERVVREAGATGEGVGGVELGAVPVAVRGEGKRDGDGAGEAGEVERGLEGRGEDGVVR
jgi:hypothetical protein